MTARVAFAAMAAAAVLAAGGCATSEPPRAPAVVRPSPGPVVVRPLFPADYVAAAASIDLFEIRSSELALARSANPRLRQFAGMMIDAHRGTSAQLSLAGRRLNLVPPAMMRDREQTAFDQLSASADFDSAYRRAQLAVHRDALKLHSDFAARGESPTLRPVAANAAAIVRRHLDQLEAL